MSRYRMRTAIGAALAAVLVAGAIQSNARAGSLPALINYQGWVEDAGGAPITGTVSVTFELFPAAASGTAVWTEIHSAVAVLDAVFDVLLGSTTPLDASHFASGDLWLQLTVDGEVMTPRQQVTSVPLAEASAQAEGLAADSVTGSMIQDGAIIPSKLTSSCGEGEVIQKTATGWQCHGLP